MLDLINKLIELDIPAYRDFSRDEKIVLFTMGLSTLHENAKQGSSESIFALAVIGAFMESDLAVKRLELERQIRNTPSLE